MDHWVFPSNWSKFDVLGAFAALHELDWRKNCNAKAGDVVFIYLGDPVGKIVLKTAVTDDAVPPGSTIDDREFSKVPPEQLADTPQLIRLKVLDSYVHLDAQLSRTVLRNNGLTSNIQGPLLLENNPRLREYVLGVDATMRSTPWPEEPHDPREDIYTLADGQPVDHAK